MSIPQFVISPYGPMHSTTILRAAVEAESGLTLTAPTFTGTVTLPSVALSANLGIETIPYALAKASGGAVGYTANYAHYLPVIVPFAITVTKIKIWVGTQSGNVDAGIYNSAGTKLVSAGSTACGATGVQILTVASTTLAPGLYYLGISCDNNTATFQRVDIGTGGLHSFNEAASFPLGATASYASEAGEQYWMEMY